MNRKIRYIGVWSLKETECFLVSLQPCKVSTETLIEHRVLRRDWYMV